MKNTTSVSYRQSVAIKVSTFELYQNWMANMADILWDLAHEGPGEFDDAGATALEVAKSLSLARKGAIRQAFLDGHTCMLLGNKMELVENYIGSSDTDLELRIYEESLVTHERKLLMVLEGRELQY